MNVRIQYTATFTAGIYHDDLLRMNHYTIKLWMMTKCVDSLSQSIAFERIKHFIYGKLDSTIFINSEHQEACSRLAAAGLDITTMPGDPVDQLIGIMLFYKLNAIMEDRILIVETEIGSEFGEGIIYLHSDQENTDLKDISPWWADPAPIHHDVDPLTNDKVVAMHKVGAWRELDLAWPDTDAPTPEDNTVPFTDFVKK
jgi:hypothetical protein